MELYIAYADRAKAVDLQETRRALEDEGLEEQEIEVDMCSEGDPDALQDQLYSRRMDSGLSTLQVIVYLIAETAIGMLHCRLALMC